MIFTIDHDFWEKSKFEQNVKFSDYGEKMNFLNKMFRNIILIRTPNINKHFERLKDTLDRLRINLWTAKPIRKLRNQKYMPRVRDRRKVDIPPFMYLSYIYKVVFKISKKLSFNYFLMKKWYLESSKNKFTRSHNISFQSAWWGDYSHKVTRS